MNNTSHRSFIVPDRSYGAGIKREVRLMASQLRFNEKRLGELDIILAELISNLVKYATDGELLVKATPDPDNDSLELISVDSGPGMLDVNQMLVDGISTGGSLGHGLGAIKRLSSEFHLYSQPTRGTVVLVRINEQRSKIDKHPLRAEVRCICVPKNGETVCGDACYSQLTNSSLTVFLGDGLGHGVLAQRAVEQALHTLKQGPALSPGVLIAAIHEATAGTRGLVGTCAVFNFTDRKWRFCGVGNIVTRLSGSLGTRGYMPYNGILGHNIPQKLVDQEMSYEQNQLLVLTSDGLHTQWNPARYPGIRNYDPSVLAAIIYKEYARHMDDMAVVVGKLY